MQFEIPSGPSLAIIDAFTEADKDRDARQDLEHNLKEWRRSGVSRLWINSLRSRGDVRLVCLVQDFHKFNTLMLDEIRSVRGVKETHTTFGFDGVANLDLLLDLEMEVLPMTDLFSCYLYLRVSPGEDRNVLEAIQHLPQDGDVRLVWALNTYNSQAGDLLLLLLSSNELNNEKFIQTHIRTISGVQDTEKDEIVEWAWMAEPDSIILLCEMFFQSEETEHSLDSMEFDYSDEESEDGY